MNIVDALTQTAKAVFNAYACSIAIIEPGQTHVIFTTASGGAEESVEGLRMPINEGIVGWVATTGQAVAVNDLASDPRFSQQAARATGYQPNEILAAPIEYEDQLIGVIEILDRDAHRPGADADLQLLNLFAQQAAIALKATSENEQRADELSIAIARLRNKELATTIINAIADSQG